MREKIEMENFVLSVEVEDGVLYISTENGSGAKYKVNSFDDVAKFIKYYIYNYIKEDQENKEED